MFKQLLGVIMIFVSIAVSAHTNEFQVLYSDLNINISTDDSGDVHESSMRPLIFFDLQSVDFRLNFNRCNDPSSPLETFVNYNGFIYHSYILSRVRDVYLIAEQNNFKNFHLRKTLYPFHSFW
ncbi:hypothetical protein DFQ11_101178 [Winogradskyella epiphytica]|uniref:Uncharacterized protein n=1 Tax=Winogradskyella epiphytica TaxID=262005 RepID=A0A2V4YFR2_9FLAO|nr:hypothetical protein [Winogradskyella epiphytica]PYE82753.1 hypothetical protein DFQ11_101178 [Winogradskyella epiphytica]GGW53360.1 hypothetical protein GCM10008085_00570 [Winogradskyella epiphytica]